MALLSDRETQIGRRLRAFRESLRIPRSAFALAIGVGSERLASYEAGRVPLRYEVFAAIHRSFFVNPAWLAEGEEPQAYEAPIDFGRVGSRIAPRWLFTEAYDRALSHFHKSRVHLANALAERIDERIAKLVELIRSERDINATREIAFLVSSRLQELDRILQELANLGLTETSPKSRTHSVKDIQSMPELISSLKALTAEPGAAAALAEDLGIPHARVSEWLSGKKEPGGANTFRLLQWVGDHRSEERKGPGSALTPLGRKTRSTRSRHDKVKSSPSKR